MSESDDQIGYDDRPIPAVRRVHIREDWPGYNADRDDELAWKAYTKKRTRKRMANLTDEQRERVRAQNRKAQARYKARGQITVTDVTRD